MNLRLRCQLQVQHEHERSTELQWYVVHTDTEHNVLYISTFADGNYVRVITKGITIANFFML